MQTGKTTDQPNNFNDNDCYICQGAIAEWTFNDRSVITTNCAHRYHLTCFTQVLTNENEAIPKPRTCSICRGQPLPLVRLLGPEMLEDSPFCETFAMHICRVGSLELINES